MLKEISVLVKLNLCNIYGINVFKHSKDSKAKKVYLALAAAILLIVVTLAVYIGVMVYGYVQIGLGGAIPAYLVMIASIMILCFGIFKAGPVIFERKGYDILCSLPVSSKSIVVARFVRMYVEDVVLTSIVMVPGIIVYGVLLEPGMSFYLAGLVITLLLPFAPITAAVILGTAFTAISSRTKHKSIVGAILPVAVVVASLGVTSYLSMTAGKLTPEMLYDLAGVVTELIATIYPPAVWFGSMMLGTGATKAICFAIFTFIAFALAVYMIGTNLQRICEKLYGTTARHNFIMGAQQQNKVLVALYKKEFKRYFASSIYFSNTIMGPVLAVVMSASLLFVDMEAAFGVLPIEIDLIGILPLAIGTTFCIMNTTSTSISMEGKEWWIVKSLPLATKKILDAKLIMNLMLFAPFYLISTVFTIIALKPLGLDLLWVIISPAVLILFSCVWGLFINLKLPVFNWENETAVVKQSMSALVGGLCSALVGVVAILALMIVPTSLRWLIKGGLAVGLIIVTVVIYGKNNKVNLAEIG